ncbi:MAG TPA: hypothetical protein VFZ82_15765 [Methylomirabilota bacterium]|jgi:hypothetical protein|nr:hypothetical protein [Methylomirabilota bacterium]
MRIAGAGRAEEDPTLSRATVPVRRGPRERRRSRETSARSIRFTPETALTLVRRSATPAPGGWPGGYAESPLAMAAVRVTARSIEVVRPAER